ncbi:MAG TPA: rod-binding protein [Syntrophales bacterium]|nr:rod-binding protein [Syntrophales bacterium]HQN77680.1 rod-binding protein [Syntrophales bacterium]HQQ26568.1 rod-binding protein [Syntrophales bacterium]
MDKMILSGVRDISSPSGGRKSGSAEQSSVEDMKLRKACADFESLFLYSLLKSMRRTVPQGSVTTGLSGKNATEMLMDQKFAEEMAGKGGGVGIQKMLYEELKNRRIGKNGVD